MGLLKDPARREPETKYSRGKRKGGWRVNWRAMESRREGNKEKILRDRATRMASPIVLRLIHGAAYQDTRASEKERQGDTGYEKRATATYKNPQITRHVGRFTCRYISR